MSPGLFGNLPQGPREMPPFGCHLFCQMGSEIFKVGSFENVGFVGLMAW